MIKNKTGFTLIEIIVCIVLISIIATISVISLNKIDEDDNIVTKIETSADIYFEENEIHKKILDQNNEIYLKISELIDTGLVSEKYKDKYNDKCVHLIKDNNDLGYETEISYDCYELPYVEPPQIIPSEPGEDLEFNFIENNGVYCYPDENYLPAISLDYIANDAKDVNIKLYVNEEEKTIVDRKYQVESNDKNIKIVLSYKLDGIEKEAIYYDNAEYIVSSEPELILVDNKISASADVLSIKKSLDNNIYTDITLDDINSSTEDRFYVEASNKCTSKKYEVNMTKSNDAINYIGNNWLGISNTYCNKITVKFLYVFPNGNILYEDYANSEDCGGPYYRTIIYNPITHKKIKLDDLGTKPNIKLEKISDTIFNIYLYADVKDKKNNYRHFKYQILQYNLENDSIEYVENVSVNIDATCVFSTKRNYCDMEYYFKDNIKGTKSKTYEAETKDCIPTTFLLSGIDTTQCLDCVYEIEDKINASNTKYKEVKNIYDEIGNYTYIEYDRTDELVNNFFRNSDNQLILQKYLTGTSSFTKTPKISYTSDNFKILKDLVWYDEEKGENIVCMPFRDEGEKDEEFAFIRYKHITNFTLNEVD